MAIPKSTLWQAEQHTLAKHAILKRYLEAWFPILARWHGRIVYYDGFAGPGRYLGGEPGSPIIAIEAALGHSSTIKSDLVFAFVEENPDRASHLEAEIGKMDLPRNFCWEVLRGEFGPTLRSELDRLAQTGQEMPATFAFVDPFGIKGLPFDLIADLLKRPRCEVLITFMTESVKRWVTELPEQVNELIGNPKAQELIACSENRVIRARELYSESLRDVAKFVRFFEMRRSVTHPIYDLFFATNHARGHERMKESMWKIGQHGAFTFSDGVDENQATLFSVHPENDLAVVLHDKYRGSTVDAALVKTYTIDETAFLGTHFTAAMKLLEQEGGFRGRKIRVRDTKSDGSPRRKNTYPSGTLVTFEK